MAKMIPLEKQVRKVVRTITGGSFGNRKIEVVRREYEEGNFTNDIMIDGKLHSPAVGDKILEEMLQRTQSAVLRGDL